MIPSFGAAIDDGTFTTTRSGRTYVAMTGRLWGDCNGATTFVVLTVDGTRLPGAIVESSRDAEVVTLQGVTAAPLAAGTHTVQARVACTSIPVALGVGGTTKRHAVTAVVLGG